MTPALLDSNIIIYAVLPDYSGLRDFLADYHFHVSEISKLEVLGYPKLSIIDKQNFEYFFTDIATEHIISSMIISSAVKLRQVRKMSLGDSIIAATALIHQLPIITRNNRDFDWNEDLIVINPFTL